MEYSPCPARDEVTPIIVVPQRISLVALLLQRLRCEGSPLWPARARLAPCLRLVGQPPEALVPVHVALVQRVTERARELEGENILRALLELLGEIVKSK